MRQILPGGHRGLTNMVTDHNLPQGLGVYNLGMQITAGLSIGLIAGFMRTK